jgi:hypothetical protein
MIDRLRNGVKSIWRVIVALVMLWGLGWVIEFAMADPSRVDWATCSLD